MYQTPRRINQDKMDTSREVATEEGREEGEEATCPFLWARFFFAKTLPNKSIKKYREEKTVLEGEITPHILN